MFVCYEAAEGKVELKWLWMVRKGIGLFSSALAKSYSFVKSWLPSLARSEGIVHRYTYTSLCYLGFVADRLLTASDVMVRLTRECQKISN